MTTHADSSLITGVVGPPVGGNAGRSDGKEILEHKIQTGFCVAAVVASQQLHAPKGFRAHEKKEERVSNCLNVIYNRRMLKYTSVGRLNG